MLKPSFSSDFVEVGLDEAGRGCLAGPVYAAAVILDPKKEIEGLNDSKQISERNRYLLERDIKDGVLAYSIGICSPEEIDEINILRASIKAMHKALKQIKKKFELILVDGNRFTPYENIPFETIVKGDGKYQSIAAASILAKCARDRYMETIHKEFEYYSWNKNKGYPTVEHRNAIIKYGPCSYHRKSFKLTSDSQINIF